MKKFFATLLIGILFLVPVFSATDSATLILKVNVIESALNTGVRITKGDKSGLITNATTFDNVFSASTSTITIEYQQGFVGGADIEELFTVLVRRGSSVPLNVDVDPTTLQKPNTGFYLGYKMSKDGVAFMDNTANPSQVPANLLYSASNVYEGLVRDVAVFKLTIPKTDQVPIGEYQANMVFTIEVP